MKTTNMIARVGGWALTLFLGTLPGFAADSVEPWQAWSQRPADAPLILQVVARAQTGTQVTLSVAGNNYTIDGAGCWTETQTNIFLPILKPHEPYTLSASGSHFHYLRIHFKPYASRQTLGIRGQKSLPRPFKVFLDNVEPPEAEPLEVQWDSCAAHSTNWVVEVRPHRGFRPVNFVRVEEHWNADEEDVDRLAPGDGLPVELGPGRDLSAAVGAFRWAVNLGRLWNGQAAGLIRLNEKSFGSNLFTAAPLTYTVRSTNLAELWVVTNAAGDLRQIRAPQTLVDIQATSQTNEQCVVKFYLLSQVGTSTNGSGLFPINTDDPFVTWRVRNPDSPGTYTRAHIVEERPGSRCYTNELRYSSASNLWSLVRGQGNEARTETRTVSIAGTNRTETVEIRSTNTVYKAVETYRKFPWAWELIQVVSNPDGNGLTNRFEYYTDNGEGHEKEYGKLKDRWLPGDSWERWYYGADGECPSWPYDNAHLGDEVRVRPWKNGPASPDQAVFTNAVFSYLWTFPNSGGGEFNRQSWDYLGDCQNNENLIRWRVEHDGNLDDPDIYSVVVDKVLDEFGGIPGTEIYRHHKSGNYRHQLLRSVMRTGKPYDLYEHFKGTFSWATKTFTEDETNGVDFLTVCTQGGEFFNEFYPEATYYPQDPSGIPWAVYVGKSTSQTTVYQQGNAVFKQRWALESVDAQTGMPIFLPVDYEVLTYDSLGHLTNQLWIDASNTNINRAVYQASWMGAGGRDCELKAWEIGETGERFNYAYDSLKRLTNVTRVGVSASGSYPYQADISTNWVYDAVGRLRTETVAAGGLTLTRSQTYDLSGRPLSVSGLDGVTTNLTYSADTRTLTNTLPGGVTLVQSKCLDGRLASLTGIGQVNEFYDYWIAPDDYRDFATTPKQVTRVSYGSSGSPRWREQATTHMDRLSREWLPGYGATNGAPPLEVSYLYSIYSQGQPATKTVPATMASDEIVYLQDANTYNSFGELVDTVSGGVVSSGRQQGQDTVYEHDGTNWFLTTYQHQFIGQCLVTNVIRQRLNGFTSSTILQDTTLIDPDTNTTFITLTLDRAAKKVTAVTNTPQSTIHITAVTINGLLQTLTSESVSTPTWHYYDALGRETATKDPLGFTSGVTYSSTNTWVLATTNPAGQVTSYQYYGLTETNAGKVKCVTHPNGKTSRYAYTPRGEPWRVWGDVPYPEERTYNSYGELTELRTYRGGSGWSNSSWPSGSTGTPDTTTCNYDAATGLLLAKTDALSRSVTNNYLLTRTPWTVHLARGVVLTNTYDEFGEIIRKDYSDGTPSVDYGYRNSTGQPLSITDAAGTRSFEYDHLDRLLAARWTDGPLYGLAVTNRYDPVYGRDRLVLDGLATPLVQDYRFGTTTGRLNVVSNGLYSVSYGYLANSDLIQTTTGKSNTTAVLTAIRTWDFGYRLRSIQNTAGTSIVSSHSYLYDEVDRRTQATLADSSSWAYGYDDRNEVISGKRYWADWTPVAGQAFEYGFDTIGNRTQTKAGGDAGGAGLLSASYTNNALNQVTGRGVPGYVDVTGAATATATSVTVNGQAVDHRKVEYYWKQLAVGNSSGPLWQGVTNSATLSNQTATVPGHLLIPPAGQSFQWDADGNLTNDLVWRYRWDGENRLVEMTNVTGLAAEGQRKLVFGYDSEGRRSAKTVYGWDTGTTNWASSPLVDRRYVYDVGADGQGWNLVAELELTNGTPVLVRSYLWGTDLSGSLPDGPQGAGGVGGLLAVTVHTGAANTHFAGYDGNGNVVVLVDGTDKSVSGRYEYGPFGEAIRVTGSMGTANPLRFSTKFTDEETGLVYYGYRYYSPSLGRWINRDPIEEQGGLNLYAFVLNRSLNAYDVLGKNSPSVLDPEASSGIGAKLDSSGAAATYRAQRSIEGTIDLVQDMQDIWDAVLSMDDPTAFLDVMSDIIADVFSAKSSGSLAGGKGDPFHHLRPQAFKDQLGGKLIHEFTQHLAKRIHDRLHGGKRFGKGGIWNTLFERFINNKGGAPKEEDIQKFLAQMLGLFGLEDQPRVPYPGRWK